ncbi:MAG TPA: hypothetical protein PLJ98_02780 [Acholeplasmataceae bacterium]|jgi:hypothetical protein|nr:hypothetical protein [Acholeplasmataceae bacterium]
MRTNSFVHTVIDYIKDILAQFNVSKQRETSIFMASDDFQSR